MAAVVRNKKPDDKFLLALRELVTNGSNGGNRQCFDCGQKGPTYVNMTIGSFVCTRCSGVLRGLTPPHRVKSISMATFTQDEIDFLKSHGNELCAKTWLGLWDPKRASQQQQDQRELIIDKYERKRYYLEPGSPLKSLNLKSSPAQNSNANAVRQNQNGHHHHHQHQANGVSLVGMSTNGYASIQLTPPAAQRTSNGQQKAVATVATASSTTAISRPQHHHHHNQHHHDAFGSLANGLTSLNSAGSTSTGALSDTSSCASNGFAAESDFVADFGSANIFDATSARSAGSPAVSSASSVSSTNGYAKVQPLRAAHLLQQQQQQQQALLNGSANSNGNTENFADFEHAPIYNAAAVSNNSNATVFHDWISDWSRRGFHDPFDDDDVQIVTPSPPVPPAPCCPPPADNEPEPLPSIGVGNFWSHEEEDNDDEDQDVFCSQLSPLNPFLPYLKNERRQRNRSIAAGPSRSGTSSCSSFVSSNSYFGTSNDNSEEQPTNSLNGNFHDIFTWSAPLQNGHLNGGSKVTPSKSSPSEDRYAALKDLDEQLRELKASETAPVVTNEAPTPANGNGNGHFIETFGTGHIINNNNNNNPNPFKGQQQQLSNHIVNPFQQQQSQQNLYGQLTLIPNGYAINPQQQQQQAAHPHPQQQQQQQASFFNFNNNGYALSQGLPNACGFGMANNPFAANTNNPFL
ncbi:alpha-protein kinase 1 isoform X1 [Drosophila tropicalis]|uniref:alpha-protein kinase 1 isoform X1 n=1 Tax=Drosophila tropicalis TaxID=46794 RepID=UPI0035AB9DCD